MSNIVTKMVEAGHLNQEEAARINQTVHEFEKEAAADPEFHEEALEKLALFGIDWRETGRVLGAGVVAAGGAQLAADVYQTAKNAILKSKNYKAMLDENPDLRKMDSKKIQRTFNTLHNFNPQYASDPLVAGAFVRQQSEYEGVDFGTLKNVVDAAHNMPSRQGVFGAALSPEQVAGAVRFQEPSDAEKLQRRAAMRENWEKLQQQPGGAGNPLGSYTGSPYIK